jgi:hypothetical protein
MIFLFLNSKRKTFLKYRIYVNKYRIIILSQTSVPKKNPKGFGFGFGFGFRDPNQNPNPNPKN